MLSMENTKIPKKYKRQLLWRFLRGSKALFLLSMSMVSCPMAPLPRCIRMPAFESVSKLPSISGLLLEVGPTPAGLTAV